MQHVEVERTGRGILASDSHVATLTLESGRVIRFERVGYKSFGPNAVNIVVGEAGGLVPRVATCSGVSAPNFHRDAPLGHHFGPTLIDVSDAATSPTLRQWGSPTILIDGIDVGGESAPCGGAACRLYAAGDGVPTDEEIETTLRHAMEMRR